MNEKFNCSCTGEVKIIDDNTISHACARKYANLTSYYDGVPKFVQYDRVRINPALTNDEVKYNWLVHWNS